MTQSLREMRAELLAQHAELRAQMAIAQAAAERCARGEPARDALSAAIARLADALARHNAREEQLLGRIIPTIDAWGPGRAETMSDAHAHEHLEVHRALVETGAASEPRQAARAALALVERIAEHMAREEQDFLGADVLDDDGRNDPFGG